METRPATLYEDCLVYNWYLFRSVWRYDDWWSCMNILPAETISSLTLHILQYIHIQKPPVPCCSDFVSASSGIGERGAVSSVSMRFFGHHHCWVNLSHIQVDWLHHGQVNGTFLLGINHDWRLLKPALDLLLRGPLRFIGLGFLMLHYDVWTSLWNYLNFMIFSTTIMSMQVIMISPSLERRLPLGVEN